MVSYKRGRVITVETRSEHVVQCQVSVDGRSRPALAYIPLTGIIEAGDEVAVNTIALDLSLGTGGYDFIAWNLSRHNRGQPPSGRMIKLRYTPWQICCAAVEEGTGKDVLQQATTIEGMPVVICGLHSQIAPVAAAIKAVRPRLKIAYVMTDSAALPAWLSSLLQQLQRASLIDVVITTGQSFGGDIEAVNVYTGMLAARHVCSSDVIVVGPGPGHVGTGTKFGFSGVEQGALIDAVNTLAGRALCAVRISFSDPRPRHQGVSHHSLTVLESIAHSSAVVAVPEMEQYKLEHVLTQLQGAAIRHTFVLADGTSGITQLKRSNIDVKTMGRNMAADKEFFLAAGASGVTAASFACDGEGSSHEKTGSTETQSLFRTLDLSSY